MTPGAVPPGDPGTDTPGAGAPTPASPALGNPAPDSAETLRDAVKAVPGVAGLHGGPFGEIATYLPGRRVPGIRSDDTGTDVHVIVRHDADLQQTALAIHRVVAALTGGPVRVHIDDLAPDPEES